MYHYHQATDEGISCLTRITLSHSISSVLFRIQSSYSALQRINQDLEEKIHRDVSVCLAFSLQIAFKESGGLDTWKGNYTMNMLCVWYH